ncbi:MAG TPA: MFS transporter, partial [Planctomycetota bacterium]|nr:MFS transporter [Planctomycetota bacterium]
MTPRRPATIGILFGIFLSAMDSTIVGTALPTIISHFGHVELYFLPISIAMIVSTVSVPVFGRLSDLYGRKRFHLVGILLVTLGSVLCSQARSIEALIVFRSIQTLGVGALMPLSFTMIADLYPLEQRAKMQGSISGVWGLAALMGPPLGGIITDRLGWEYVFLVPLPLGFVSLLIIQRVWKDAPRPERVARPDLPGAVLLVLASAVLLGGLGLARDPHIGWTHAWTLSLFAACAILATLLAVVERRSHDPFIAVDLFRRRLFWTGTLCSSLMGAVMFCALSYLPLYVQSALGATP